MTLLLRDTGIAIAYATVGVGDVDEEMRAASEAGKRLRAEAAKRLRTEAEKEKKGKSISLPETIFLLGQADVASIYETSNFMRIFDLRYPTAESNATVVNWVFSASYDLGRKSVPPPGFRFIVHLRFRRSVYAFPEIDQKVVDKLRELLGSLAKDARFHAGLGWSDLIVDGTFTSRTFESFARFIIELHGLQIRFGSGSETRSIPLLQMMLTVLGYTGDPPAFEKNAHLTFLRAKSARYDDVLRLLPMDRNNAVFMLDGKADFMMVSRKGGPKWLARQRKLGQKENRDMVRKIETHLMYFPARKFMNAGQGDRLFLDFEEPFDRDRCGCRDVSSAAVLEIERTIKGLGGKLLRSGQRHAIDNTLFLLSSALRNSSICCDAVDAILASYDGLLTILRSLAKLKSKVTDPSEQYRYIVSLWARLDDWHRFSELLLRQRTVGSYEEILGQSDRSVVYSGGVQKFLYLADQLVVDFAKRLEPTKPPKFAMIYDSVKTILSHRIGVVRVPTSKMFSVPHIVADLWHEVAGTLFFVRKGRDIAKFAPQKQKTEFLERLADHYADLLVYLYGFGGDFDRFLDSLAFGWVVTYGDVDEVVQRWSIGEFLLRAYLVYEFHELRRVQGDFAAAAGFINPAKTAELVEQLADIFTARHPSIVIRPEDLALLQRNVVTQDFSDYHRNLYREFVRVPAHQISGDIRPFLRGAVTPLEETDDLNDLFAELSNVLSSLKTGAFRAMAALGRSAAVEYHRRQVLRRERFEPPPRGAEPPDDPDETPVITFPQNRRRSVAGRRYEPNEVIGGCKIERYIASGNMGDVYAAMNATLSAKVALKVAKPDGSGQVLERMIEEVKLGRSVTSPNVCRIHNVGRTPDGRPFIEMELIEGESFASLISRTAPFSVERGSEIVGALFNGLAAIHGTEPPIVHRDLKPANVMYDQKSVVRIMDFGLATLATAKGVGAGTRNYMAPELFLGHAATTASDVYSAGLIALEMFAPRGKDAEGHGSATQIKIEELLAARSAAGSWRAVPIMTAIPKRVRELILSCLEDKPAARPSAVKMRSEWQKLARPRRLRR